MIGDLCLVVMDDDEDVDCIEALVPTNAWTPRPAARNGVAVRVRSHAQNSDIAPALVSEKKIKKGRVAPAPYVPKKKWKVILHFDTSNTVQLDTEYRKYYQY